VTLRRQVVDFVGLDFLDDPNQVGRIRQISIVQLEADVFFVRILVKMINAIGVERGCTAFDAMHAIPLIEQELGQIGTVLPGNARDQRRLRQVQPPTKLFSRPTPPQSNCVHRGGETQPTESIVI